MTTYMDSDFKRFSSIHDKLAFELNRYLEEKNILEWMTEVKTTLIQNDLQKGTTMDQ